MPFHWLPKTRGLTDVELTVRAQAVAANNLDRLTFEAFFRRTTARSMKVAEISGVDFRPVATHRAWNTDPGTLPHLTGPIREAQFLPIGSYFDIGEEEMQELETTFSGNEQVFAQQMKVTVPERVQHHVLAAKRRQQIEAYIAWQDGAIRIVNPAKQVITHSLGFDAGRFETAPTIWTDAGVNAYDEFIAFIRRGMQAGVMPVGAQLSQKVLSAILADAPKNMLTGQRAGVAAVQQYVQDETGISNFTFVTNDQTYHTAPGQVARYWDEGKVALIPQGRYVGEARYAPVVRAAQITREVPEAKVNSNDVAVFYTSEQSGKLLKVETQLNAYPWPDERKVFVMDTLI